MTSFDSKGVCTICAIEHTLDKHGDILVIGDQMLQPALCQDSNPAGRGESKHFSFVSIKDMTPGEARDILSYYTHTDMLIDTSEEEKEEGPRKPGMVIFALTHASYFLGPGLFLQAMVDLQMFCDRRSQKSYLLPPFLLEPKVSKHSGKFLTTWLWFKEQDSTPDSFFDAIFFCPRNWLELAGWTGAPEEVDEGQEGVLAELALVPAGLDKQELWKPRKSYVLPTLNDAHWREDDKMTLSSMGFTDWLNDIRARLDEAGDGEVLSLRQDNEGRRSENSKLGSECALDSDTDNDIDETENNGAPDEKNKSMELDDADKDKETTEGKDGSEGC